MLKKFKQKKDLQADLEIKKRKRKLNRLYQ